MGAAMAVRLAAAGHRVTVTNRTLAKAEAVAARTGAAVAGTAREAVAGADLVVVSLADDAALRAAYDGPDGLLAGLAPGQLVADTSTVAPATTRELGGRVAERGAALVDTPVSGSVASVEAGSLLVMAGGEAADVARAEPVLLAFASKVVHLGRLGAGATMKLVVNALLFGLNQALAENLVLAERAGVDRALAYDVIASSAVGAPFVAYKRAAFTDPGSVPVAFALDLAAKDLDLAAALAAEVGARIPQGDTNRAVVQAARDAGLGQADLSALADLLRR
jgi:3-hydroxyisobutyrate dehydrogenase-like beta-hydroxyacid dehydrogenase